MLQGVTLAPHLPDQLLGTRHQLPGPGLVSADPDLPEVGMSPSRCLGTSRSRPDGEQMGRGHAGHHPQSVLGGARR